MLNYRLKSIIDLCRKDIFENERAILDDNDKAAIEDFLSYALPRMLINEIMFDLYQSFKKNTLRFKNDDDIREIISSLYMKYSLYIKDSISKFEKKLPKLLKESKQKKIEILKIKRIPDISAPINITYDVRFAVLKRADRKCEICNTPVTEMPIDVYQLKETEMNILLLALCQPCMEKNKSRIISDNNELQ